MTTPGDNGEAPDSAGQDDPFAYLYRPADGEQPVAERPRTGYSRPMEVGRATYGERPAQPQTPPPPAFGPGAEATTALPQQSRYAERSRPRPGEDRPAGRGKATVIGAVAVVAAIAIGAGVALSTGDPGGKPQAGATGHTTSAPSTAGTGASGSASPSASASAASDPIGDASKLQAQGASPDSTVKGAISADGSYLVLQAGSTVTWTVNADTAGQTKFWLHFNNTGTDQPAQVTVNGKEHPNGVTFKNYSKNPSPDPNQSWYSTNIWPTLVAGPNTITVTVPAGAANTVLLDQVALTPMSVSSYPTK
ncbi:hypothetical protein [Streptomyces sp. TLI_171]|uniref:hypothetical protein n=1 Tax=Streptomyces sp. TLI_171 TaxID=1938859 RepID=UPI000C19664A|nr:hypothetical protein [Streptomyces sp. TLI_171]RKE20614.1 hypothetical protein BX266_3983 [Streptomyces sp. TLI_171]